MLAPLAGCQGHSWHCGSECPRRTAAADDAVPAGLSVTVSLQRKNPSLTRENPGLRPTTGFGSIRGMTDDATRTENPAQHSANGTTASPTARPPLAANDGFRLSVATAITLTGWSERTVWRRIADGTIASDPAQGKSMIAFAQLQPFVVIPLTPEDCSVLSSADAGDAEAQNDLALLFLPEARSTSSSRRPTTTIRMRCTGSDAATSPARASAPTKTSASCGFPRRRRSGMRSRKPRCRRCTAGCSLRDKAGRRLAGGQTCHVCG